MSARQGRESTATDALLPNGCELLNYTSNEQPLNCRTKCVVIVRNNADVNICRDAGVRVATSDSSLSASEPLLSASVPGKINFIQITK